MAERSQCIGFSFTDKKIVTATAKTNALYVFFTSTNISCSFVFENQTVNYIFKD
jgi:hypothetical protein